MNEYTDWISGISPADLGLPPKFECWRDQQDVAINRSLSSSKRFVAQAMPTGMGKSLVYIAEALLTDKRTAILTSTKGLQDQLVQDFSGVGLVAVKGRNNFMCVNHPGRSCEDGAHKGCLAFKHQSGCGYKAQYNAAMASRLIVTNYAYWSLIHRYGEGLGQFDLLVLDEGHDAPEAICSVMDVPISDKEVHSMLRCDWPVMPLHPESWRGWANQNMKKVNEATALFELQKAKGHVFNDEEVKLVKAWQSLLGKLSTLRGMTGEWAVEVRTVQGSVVGYKICLVWPRSYSESILFRGVPKVVIVSATLLPKTDDLLGIKTHEADFNSYPYVFPKSRTPVYAIPTLKLSYKTTEDEFRTVVDRCDEIITGRLDRKGIIHTTSYKRARLLSSMSQFASIMVVHSNDPGDAVRAAERFKLMEAPAVLVTPSMTTGYDFPMDTCEYQIIIKAPYADIQNPVIKRRMDHDHSYSHFTMAQTLVQTCGRGMRSVNDQCENFIIDDTVKRIVQWKPGLFPAWFRELWTPTDTVPEPPPPHADASLPPP